jgi:hypothetical protein
MKHSYFKRKDEILSSPVDFLILLIIFIKSASVMFERYH